MKSFQTPSNTILVFYLHFIPRRGRICLHKTFRVKARNLPLVSFN